MTGGVGKGALAGMAGGVLGSLTMNAFQALWTLADEGPRAAWESFEQGGQLKKSRRQRWPWLEEPQSATMRAADGLGRAFLRRRLRPGERRVAGGLAHFVFGGLTGALYGSAAEIAPAVTRGVGLVYGSVVWLLADEIGVPLLRLSKSPLRYPASVHAQSFGAHLVFGLTVEAVRGALRQGR
ncbi:MAG: DUF1440 domain-containing protein [Acidobacteriota bacterium]